MWVAILGLAMEGLALRRLALEGLTLEGLVLEVLVLEGLVLGLNLDRIAGSDRFNTTKHPLIWNIVINVELAQGNREDKHLRCDHITIASSRTRNQSTCRFSTQP